MEKSIILVGGGGHCKSCIDVIEQEGIYTITGVIDLPEHLGETILGYRVIGNDSDLKELVKTNASFLVTLGQIRSAERRIQLFQELKKYGAVLPKIISPLAYVSSHASIGEGSVVMHHACVNANAIIGENCIINSKALIEHDVSVESHCHISTGAIINGNSSVGHSTFIGSNAVIRESLAVPALSFIKAQSLRKT